MLRNIVISAKSSLQTVSIANKSAGMNAIRAMSQQTRNKLSAVLDKEVKYEKEQSESLDQMPEEISSMLKSLHFELVANDGERDCKLVRVMGNEKITVSFGIVPDEQDVDEDFEVEEEIEEEAEDDETSSVASFPVTIDVTKTVDGKDMGTLTFYAASDVDDSLLINDVEFTAKSALATTDTAEAEHQRRSKYSGPKFGDLDEKVQNAFSEYLDERGVNEDMVAFIAEYSDWKEQKEYVKWLEVVQKFVSKQ